MSKPAKRDEPERRPTKVEPAPVQQGMSAKQIVLRRIRQGCYGVTGASLASFPGAFLGEHFPATEMLLTIGIVAVFAAVAGVCFEVLERRLFPGGKDDV